MTSATGGGDTSADTAGVPGRLGTTAHLADGVLTLGLVPTPPVLRHGVVRASVLSYLVDCVAGIPLDDDPDSWSLTSDMSVRALAAPAPDHITATNRILRRGGRSATCDVELHDDDGTEVGWGAIGFARVRRRPDDPPKHSHDLDELVAHFADHPPLSAPLRTEAGIEVVDAGAGVVELPLRSALRNSAGTLQGAMVALVAEAAAEDLLSARAGRPVVITDLDLRYLERTRDGPVRTRARALGPGPDATVVVELIDRSRGRVTTLVHARGATVDDWGPLSPPG